MIPKHHIIPICTTVCDPLKRQASYPMTSPHDIQNGNELQLQRVHYILTHLFGSLLVMNPQLLGCSPTVAAGTTSLGWSALVPNLRIRWSNVSHSKSA